MEWAELPSLFPGIPRPERWLPLLQRHAELITENEEAVRVSAVPAEEVVRRQYAESLETWRIAEGQRAAGPLVDVGSGGGFPGLVIAIAVPHVEVHLVEPLGKRARFLEEMAEELRLSNVIVHGHRAEEVGRSPLRDAAGLVTARAVARLAELLEYVAPFAAPGGCIALPKGSQLDEELAEAERALAELRCELIDVEPMRAEVSEQVRVLLLRKSAETPERYPRRAGMPGKRPL